MSAMLEQMERRVLLSASIHDGVLIVRGTAKDDQMTVGYGDTADRPVEGVTGKYVEVTINNVTSEFPADRIHKVVVLGGAGNDSILLSGDVGKDGALQGLTGLLPVPIKAIVNGGSGNDDLSDGTNKTTLIGAGGDDRFWSYFSNTVIRGAAGNDYVELHSTFGADLVSGGAGNDIINSVNPSDHLFGNGGINTFNSDSSSVKDFHSGDIQSPPAMYFYPG